MHFRRIQTLKRLRPAVFRQDLIALFDLLKQKKIKPLVTQRLPLVEARQAQELLGKGGATGKILLVCNRSKERVTLIACGTSRCSRTAT
jgi:NADPH:quinone reductase-like Zn-dependent oxidoreductase